MPPPTAEDEATPQAIAERHGFYAARGPHTGEGSASRLIDALLAGEVVTLALGPADRRRGGNDDTLARAPPSPRLPHDRRGGPSARVESGPRAGVGPRRRDRPQG